MTRVHALLASCAALSLVGACSAPNQSDTSAAETTAARGPNPTPYTPSEASAEASQAAPESGELSASDATEATPEPEPEPQSEPEPESGPSATEIIERDWNTALDFFSEAPPSAQSSQHPERLGYDGLSGYYMPKNDVAVETRRGEETVVYTFSSFAMPMPWEEEGEDGPMVRQAGEYSFIQFGFRNLDGPSGIGEVGIYYEDSFVVSPHVYSVTPEGMTWLGASPELDGLVMFEGTWDVDALYRADLRYGDATVARGRMSVAGTTFDSVEFTYFEGH